MVFFALQDVNFYGLLLTGNTASLANTGRRQGRWAVPLLPSAVPQARSRHTAAVGPAGGLPLLSSARAS